MEVDKYQLTKEEVNHHPNGDENSPHDGENSPNNGSNGDEGDYVDVSDVMEGNSEKGTL
jgi:hypothetical protein